LKDIAKFPGVYTKTKVISAIHGEKPGAEKDGFGPYRR
jgi:hypothetical protein